MGRARAFWASVHMCMLQTFPNFACNLIIGPSSFPILVTKLQDHSFYEKQKRDWRTDGRDRRNHIVLYIYRLKEAVDFRISKFQISVPKPCDLSTQQILSWLVTQFSWRHQYNHTEPAHGRLLYIRKVTQILAMTVHMNSDSTYWQRLYTWP